MTASMAVGTAPAMAPRNATSGFLEPEMPIPGLPGTTIGSFWQWAYSDILSNRNRSIFAEFLVGHALGVVDKPRVEWDAVDLRCGAIKIEIKSAAYLQSWPQKSLSVIRFDVGKAVPWDASTGDSIGPPVRSADVYVFCHYAERDRSKVDVLNLPAWDFYVVSTAVLNRLFGEAKSLSLETVRRIATPCKWEDLRAAVQQASGASQAEGPPEPSLASTTRCTSLST